MIRKLCQWFRQYGPTDANTKVIYPLSLTNTFSIATALMDTHVDWVGYPLLIANNNGVYIPLIGGSIGQVYLTFVLLGYN